MMEKINRQFDILNTQTKRFQKLSETYTVESSLFSALVGAIRSVVMISSNISSSFIQILHLDQIKALFKNNYSLINQILTKMGQLNTKIQIMKKQKQSMKTKGNNQNCTICGENIHESNIKQAKIYLQEQSMQKFQLAMEQFKKIAEVPIHTKEQNNQFEQKLHYQLSQRERVLNTNCNRIEEYVEVMEGALADLMKMKQIELNQNQIQNVQFINMNKINEDVSSILQSSFLKKIPPWIHKMFLRMIASYVQQCNKRKEQKSIQTSPNEYVSKQIREYVKEKREIQKQNKELNDQLKQLKLCYKKMQQINNQYSLTIASLSRNIKHRTQTYKQPKSKRNSKHTVKGQKDKSQNRIQSLSNDGQNPDDYYDMYDEINFTKKKRIRLFPQIKNKYEANITKKGSKAQIESRKQNSIDRDSNGRLTQRSKDATSRKKIPDGESKQRQLFKKEESTDRKRNDKRPQIQKIEQSSRQSVKKQERTKMREKRYQQNNQNGRKSKQIQYNIKGRNTKKLESSSTVKVLVKNNKINAVSGPKKQSIEEGGIREISDHTSNKQNKKRQNENDRNINRSYEPYLIEKQDQNDEANQKKNHHLEDYQNNRSIEALQNYNKRNNQKELMYVKKISEDLSNKINLKKNSLYAAEMTDQNQNSSIVLRKIHKNNGLYQSNTEVIKNIQAFKYQNRYQDINKENLKEYIKICKQNKKSQCESQGQERKSQILESKKNRNRLNHQQDQKTPMEKSMKNSKNSPHPHNISESKQAQKKIFQILKSNHILQKSVNYKQFYQILSNLSLNHSNDQENALDSQRKSSLIEQVPQENLQQAHNSIYGRLFINKVVAYKYQQSMAKSYHKRVLKQLNESQRDYCYEMYSDLCEAKKIGKETYHQFCSILRYPYQTLYNNFQVVNFMTDMSFDTFQYFFRKIIWIHRKCAKGPNKEICQHIESVSQQLKEILRLKS